MGAPRQHVVEDPEVWLGVQEASVMLGVSPATLRRWSAAGKVRAFTTPGGHRRFAESTIRQLLALAVGPDASAQGLGESSERVLRLVGERLRLPCLGTADSGRSVVEGLLGYVDARTDDERESALGPAVEAAARHGRLTAERHGDLAEIVEAFHRLRSLLVDDLADLACVSGLTTAQAMRIIARVNEGVDRLVAALVEAHAAGPGPWGEDIHAER